LRRGIHQATVLDKGEQAVGGYADEVELEVRGHYFGAEEGEQNVEVGNGAEEAMVRHWVEVAEGEVRRGP
jgi:hypothetical protein